MRRSVRIPPRFVDATWSEELARDPVTEAKKFTYVRSVNKDQREGPILSGTQLFLKTAHGERYFGQEEGDPDFRVRAKWNREQALKPIWQKNKHTLFAVEKPGGGP